MKLPVYEIFIDDKPRKAELTRTGENSFKIKVDDKYLNVELQREKTDHETSFFIKADGKTYHVNLPKIDLEKPFQIKVEEAIFKAEAKIPTKKQVFTAFEPARFTPISKAAVAKQASVEGAVTAPMTGKILSIKVKKGDQVKAGQTLCLLEAMKMENEIAAPKSGTVREVYVSEGSSVSEGEAILMID